MYIRFSGELPPGRFSLTISLDAEKSASLLLKMYTSGLSSFVYISCKKFRTVLLSDKKVSENKTVLNF